MTVLPGSLDYLYYNGILDRIPYEAYEMGPVVNSGMQSGLPSIGSLKQSVLNGNGAQMSGFNGNNNYLNTAMKGQMYGNYGNSADYFAGSNSYQQMGGMQSTQMYGGGYGYGGVDGYPAGGANAYNPQGAAQLHGFANGNGYGQYDERQHSNSLISSVKSSTEGVLNSRPWAKGLLSLAIIIATPLLLIARIMRKPAKPVKPKSTFWAKLNPKNWFKKSVREMELPPEPPKKTFWSKLNPKNWFKKK